VQTNKGCSKLYTNNVTPSGATLKMQVTVKYNI